MAFFKLPTITVCDLCETRIHENHRNSDAIRNVVKTDILLCSQCSNELTDTLNQRIRARKPRRAKCSKTDNFVCHYSSLMPTEKQKCTLPEGACPLQLLVKPTPNIKPEPEIMPELDESNYHGE